MSQQMKKAIQSFKSLTAKERKEFIKETEDLVCSIEEKIDEYFADDEFARALYKEKIRDVAQAKQIEVQDDTLAHVVCAKQITYSSFENIFSSNVSSRPPEDLARKAKTLWHKKQAKDDGEVVNSEYMKYMRGYCRHWHRTIDENDCDEEIGDIEWINEIEIQ